MNDERYYSAARVRDATVYFFAGKVATGGLALAWLIILLRHLSPSEYGAYVVLLAVFEITNALSGFGTPDVVQRFLPEARVRGSSTDFVTLLLRTLQIRILAAIWWGAILFFAFEALTSFVGLDPPNGLARLFAGFFIAESLLRFFNDHLLGALLAQKAAQRNQIVKNVIRLSVVLLLISLPYTLTLNTIFELELVSAICALFFAFREVKQLKSMHRQQEPATEATTLDLRRMLRFGLFNYLTVCIYQVYGSETLKLVVARLLGATEAASYGMAAALTETIRKYLPLFLFHGVIRPSLVARYAENRSCKQQNHLCNFVFKLNLFVLAPIVAFMAVSGDAFGAWISAGKYPSVGLLLTVMTALIVTQAQRLVYAMLASVYTFPGASLCATVVSVIALPLSVLLGREYGAIGVLGGTLASDVIWIAVVVIRLRMAGLPYVPDWEGIGKLLASAMVGGILASMFAPYSPNLFGVISAAFVVTGAYVAAVLLSKPFDYEDRLIIGKLIPKSLRLRPRKL